MSDAITPRAKLLEIEQVEKTDIWRVIVEEIRRREKAATVRAIDLDLPDAKRAGGAGAATEFGQLLEFIGQHKRNLESKLKK